MEVVVTTKHLIDVVKKLEGADILFIDTEFYRKSLYHPQLSLIQINYKNNIYIIDILSKNMDYSILTDILDNKNIIKVMHSSAQDIEAINKTFSIRISNIFDTQIAAEYCYNKLSLGYKELVKTICNHTIDKRYQFFDWRIRPIGKAQLKYAEEDVGFLPEVYNTLCVMANNKKVLNYIIYDSNIYHSEEENIKRLLEKFLFICYNKVQFLIVVSLILWREEKAKALDIPRGRCLSDKNIVQIVRYKNLDNKNKEVSGLLERSANRAPSVNEQKYIEYMIELKTAYRRYRDSSELKDLLRLRQSAASQIGIFEKKIASDRELVMYLHNMYHFSGWRKRFYER